MRKNMSVDCFIYGRHCLRNEYNKSLLGAERTYKRNFNFFLCFFFVIVVLVVVVVLVMAKEKFSLARKSESVDEKCQMVSDNIYAENITHT